MTLQFTTTTTALPQPGRNPRRTLLGMAALALTVAAGIVAWQITGPRTVTSLQPATASTWESTAPATTGHPADASILYLVRSQQDVELMQRIAAAIGGQQTASSHALGLNVLVSDEDAATLAAVLTRSTPLSIVDLRSP